MSQTLTAQINAGIADFQANMAKVNGTFTSGKLRQDSESAGAILRKIGLEGGNQIPCIMAIIHHENDALIERLAERVKDALSQECIMVKKDQEVRFV